MFSANLCRFTLLAWILTAGAICARAGSVLLDGVNDYAAPSSDSGYALPVYTVEAWFKRGAGGTTAFLNNRQVHPLVTRGNCQNFGLVLETNGQLTGTYLNTSSAYYAVTAPVAAPAGEWHHGALTYDGATLRLYLDGQPAGEMPAPVPPATTNGALRIGQFYSASGNAANGATSGYFAEVRIWNQARAAAQIAKHYRESVTFAPGLLSRWGFEDAAAADGFFARGITLSNGAALNADSPPLLNSRPSAAIVAPASGSIFTLDEPLVLTITATDPDNDLNRVDIYDGLTKISQTTTASVDLAGLPTGRHLLYAVGVDATGRENGSSIPLVLDVVPPGGAGAVFLNGASAFGSSGPSANGLSQFTAETWFRMEGAGTPATFDATIGGVVGLVHRGLVVSSHTNFLLAIRPSDNLLVGGFTTNLNRFCAIGRTPIARGVWHHAAVTFDGTFVRLFLNGILETELRVFEQPSSTASSPTRLGAIAFSSPLGTQTNGFFHGTLAETRVWSQPRPGGALGGAHRFAQSGLPNLHTHWKMSEGGGITVSDSAASATHLTLSPVSSWTDGPALLSGSPPTASLTAPTQPQIVARGQSVVFQASAQDDNNVARVEFWDQITKLGETASPPHAFTWVTNRTGVHRVSAVAYDNDGLAGASAPVTVTVTSEGTAGAACFDGATGRAQSGSTNNSLPQFTIETWFRRDQTGFATAYDGQTAIEPLFTRASVLGLSQSDGRVFAWFGGTRKLVGTSSSVFGSWRHAAATYDGTTARLYVDGSLEAEEAMTGISTGLGLPVTLGAHESSATRAFFAGALDEVRLWSYARTAAEIAGAKSQAISTQPGLISRWGFSEGSGSTATATGESAYALSFSGGVTWGEGISPAPGAPPVVTITGPASGSSHPILSPLVLTCDATDPDNAIGKVEFYAGNTKLGEDTEAPYAFTFETDQLGTVRFRAVASDVTGNAGSSNFVNVTFVPPDSAGGLYFNGTSSYVSFTPPDALAASEFTVEAWIRPESGGTASTLPSFTSFLPVVARGSAADGFNFALGLDGFRRPMAVFTRSSGGTVEVFGTTPVPFGQWQHFAASYDGKALRVYLNGILEREVLTYVGPVLNANQRLAFGTILSAANTRSGYFKGFIGDARIWNFARPAAAIRGDLYAGTFSGVQPSAHWRLDEAGAAPIQSTGSAPAITGSPTNVQRTVGQPAPAHPVPTITLTADASSIPQGATASLSASPAVATGTITKVEFFSDTAKLGETIAAPWTSSVGSATPARLRITAVATTSEGMQAASNSVLLTIEPIPGSGGIYLDGTDDDLTLPPSSPAPLVGTVECWFRRDGDGVVFPPANPAVPLLSRGRPNMAGEVCDYFLGFDGLTGNLMGVVGSLKVVSATSVPFGTWQHAALSWDGSGLKLYLNGALAGSGNAPGRFAPSSSQPSLGTSLAPDGTAHGRFCGAIDEARLWSSARTAAEIAEAMDRPLRSAIGLVSRLGFDEAQGVTTPDSAFGGGAATLRGGALRVDGRAFDPAPPAPSLAATAPADGAIISPPKATLEAQIEAAAPGSTWQFRGKPLPSNAGDFTIAVLPEVVNYTHSRSGGAAATLHSMMDWVVAQRQARNIVFVSQTGNLVDASAPDAEAAWTVATQAFAKLEDPVTTQLASGIPFGIAPGATDMAATNAAYGTHFSRDRFAGRGWFGAENTGNADNLQLFTAGGTDFAVANLAYHVNFISGSPSLNWLGAMLARYPSRAFIIVLHDSLLANESEGFSAAGSVLWNFLSTKKNVIAVLGGAAAGEQRRSATIEAPGVVHFLGANFSGRPNGGDGWLRLLEFSPSKGTIRSRAYSPLLNAYEQDADSDFVLPWANAKSSAEGQAITAAAPLSSVTVSAAWNSLLPGRDYEWSAEVTSGLETFRSAARRLTTAIPGPSQYPLVTLQLPAGSMSATLPAAIYVEASASSSDDAIETVQFFANDVCIGTDQTAPYGLIWHPGSVGTYQLTARAIDTRGLSSVSGAATVTIAPEGNAPAPTASITGPFSTHYGTPTVIVTANASVAAPSAIESVQFFVDGTRFAVDTEAPYSAPLSLTANGVYRLNVIATTTSGTSTMSADYNVTLRPLSNVILQRGPYLQNAMPTEMTVRWRTSQFATARIWYGTSPDALINTMDAEVPAQDHDVRVTGLAPNTRYYYAVGVSGGVIAGGGGDHNTFVTAPLPGRARHVRIWAVGDSGTGQAGQKATRDGFYGFTGARGADMLLLLGDNAYNTATDAEYQTNHFDIYAPFLRKTPSWATIGNHESDGSFSDLSYTYLKVFNHPKAGEAGGVPSGTERYYSFDYGNIHFISLDSMTSSRTATGPMATWLKNDLAATTARWIVAFWHHPPYSKGGWDSDTQTPQIEMRQVFNPILEQHGVDLVLGGHSHNYERSHFMSGHYGLSSSWNAATMRKLPGLGQPGLDGAYVKDISTGEANKGTVYVVAGSAASLYTASLNHPAMVVSRNQLGTAVVDVRGNQLDLKFVRDTGAVSDWFTIIKPWGNGDADGDGLPDEYENEYGLNASIADGAADADGDGVSNRDEYLSGTDPNDPQSRLMAGITANGGGFAVRFQSVPGRTYAVERCEDLGSPVWNSVASGIAGTGAEITVTDSAGGAMARFYRIKVE